MERDPDRSLLLRIPEVALELRLARSSVYQLIQSDELPVVRFGRSVRVPRAALEAWIEQRFREQQAREMPSAATKLGNVVD